MRARPLAALTAAVAVGLTALGATPALAQSNPSFGGGSTYYLSGALNTDGRAQAVFTFGNRDDVVFLGDWYGAGIDLPMVRRGNTYYVPDLEDPRQTAAVFQYGNPGDEVLAGDWDGDGVDTLMVRRGNQYFVRNDFETGVAQRVFAYGNADDRVVAGNWDGLLAEPSADDPGKGDTLMVIRGNRYLVANTLSGGVADATFVFGNERDAVLVGDWALGGVDSDGADQLAVRRGNTYHLSGELVPSGRPTTPIGTTRVFAYGNADDQVFVAALPTPVDDAGRVVAFDDATDFVVGDGLGVRRTR